MWKKKKLGKIKANNKSCGTLTWLKTILGQEDNKRYTDRKGRSEGRFAHCARALAEALSI